jgi:hypothetical protein
VRRTAQLRFRVPGHIWHPFETHPGLCLASIFGQHHQKAQQMSHPYHKKKTCQITNGKTTNQTPRVKNSQDSANFFIKKKCVHDKNITSLLYLKSKANATPGS